MLSQRVCHSKLSPHRNKLSNSQLESWGPSKGQGHSRVRTVPVPSDLVKCHSGNKSKWKSCFALWCHIWSWGLLQRGVEESEHRNHTTCWDSLTFSTCFTVAHLRAVICGNTVIVWKKLVRVHAHVYQYFFRACLYACENGFGCNEFKVAVFPPISLSYTQLQINTSQELILIGSGMLHLYQPIPRKLQLSSSLFFMN